jgi:hypothetical protein
MAFGNHKFTIAILFKAYVPSNSAVGNFAISQARIRIVVSERTVLCDGEIRWRLANNSRLVTILYVCSDPRKVLDDIDAEAL